MPTAFHQPNDLCEMMILGLADVVALHSGNETTDIQPVNRHCASEVHERLFSTKEVAKHCEIQSCWVIIHNVVYDLTDFIYDVS